MKNLNHQYHISGAVKSAVAYVLDGSVNGASSNTVDGANSVPKVLYSETLYYEDCDSEGCTPQYNGNISRMVHHLAHINQFFSTERDVAYYYDELNRLTKVDDKNERDFYDEAFTYDPQGRITSQRRDGYVDNATGGEYSYYVQSNRLEKVSAGMSNDADFNRNMTSNENFLYDRDGNMVEDKSKKMTLKYDHRGLPVEFKREVLSNENGADSVRLVLNYDGAGSRISKIRERKSASETEWTTELATHYTGIGSEIREDAINNATKVVVNLPQGLGRYDIASASESSSSESSANDNAANTVPSFEWYLKNHLGSTMLVYGTQGISDPTISNLGSLKAAYDYRAFGEQVDLTRYTDKVTETFTGKEKDDETELSYFGARYLDQMLGLWVSVDAKRQFNSPYLYMGNGYNPIIGFDSDGNKATILKNGNNLIILIPVAFTGDGATIKNMNDVTRAVEKQFSGQFGKYTVSTQVIQEKLEYGANIVNLSKWSGRGETRQAESKADIYMGNNNPLYGALHEFAHLFGIDDQYKDVGEESITNKGFETNLMGANNQFDLKESQIEEMLYGPESKYNIIEEK